MSGIRAINLNKIYSNGVQAVKDFNIEIADGQFITLVGPSGCGKSTFLHMIAGLENITEGELFIGDRKVNDIGPSERNIAMVFQNHALYPTMTVYDNMALGLEMQKVPKKVICEKIYNVAEMLGITDLLDRKPRQMSGGQCQRAAIGRAIVKEPEAFLLDEPLSNLDAALRDQMRLELINLHKKLGTTFIYVTHDRVEAMTMADQIVVMDKGIIMQRGAPMDVYAHPHNKFTAGFISTPQINFLPCVIECHNGSYEAKIADFTLPLDGNQYDMAALTKATENGLPLTIGIRPEHMSITPKGIEASVEYVELTGGEAYLHLNVSGMQIVVKAPAKEYPQHVCIALEINKIYLFDTESGQSFERG